MRSDALGAMLLSLAALTVCACQPQPPEDQPGHPLLDELDLAPPPVNRPAAARPARTPTAEVQFPGGEASVAMLLRDGRPFQGTLEATGQMTVTSDRIRLDLEDEGTFEIRYRLPRGIGPLPQEEGRGTVRAVERTGPEGADRHLVVQLGSRLLMAETWRLSPEPVTLALGDGLRIAQGVVQPRSEAQYTEVPVQALEGDRMLATLAVGQATTLETRAGALTVYVEVSHLLTPREEDADQVAGGFILRAWVVR